jgi:hypothetical protein
MRWSFQGLLTIACTFSQNPYNLCHHASSDNAEQHDRPLMTVIICEAILLAKGAR